jgi:uncharacterized membrane protein
MGIEIQPKSLSKSEGKAEDHTSAAPGKFGTLALVAAGAVIAATLIYGVFFQPDFLKSLADVNVARGLITFLFAFGTIAVIILIAIATFWGNVDEVERRVAIAKDTLTILIGIFGTILGFYFGAMTANPPPAPPADVSAPQ